MGLCDDYIPPTSCPSSPDPRRQWRVYANTAKSAATDNKIGARVVGYDGCGTAGPWTQRIDTGWSYSGAGATSKSTPVKYGSYGGDNCTPPNLHHYRVVSSHLFTNNNPFLNTTKTLIKVY
jgi:hypothetical protein